MGQSARRLCTRPCADRAVCGGCRAECGRDSAQITGVALGSLRACRAGRELHHALWLEFAAGVEKDPGARRSAAADHGMAAGGFLKRRAIGSLPAARAWARIVSRHLAAADAHPAAARDAAYGLEPGAQPGDACAAGAAVSRKALGEAARRRRS